MNSGLKGNVDFFLIFLQYVGTDFLQEKTKHFVFLKDDIQLLGITMTRDKKNSTEGFFCKHFK